MVLVELGKRDLIDILYWAKYARAAKGNAGMNGHEVQLEERLRKLAEKAYTKRKKAK